MTVSWWPVVWVDVLGSAVTLLIAVRCAMLAWQWAKGRREDTFRHYILLLTFAVMLFAVSRSFGHLVKQLLLVSGRTASWQAIAPYSGAVNTATFVVIFAFGIYFHRQHIIHQQLEEYKSNLEAQVQKRTAQLAAATLELEQEIRVRKHSEGLRVQLIGELQNALNSVKLLKGMLPICSSCKKIRDDQGYWNQIEQYIREHSEVEFTHGICPECMEKLYPELMTRIDNKKNGSS